MLTISISYHFLQVQDDDFYLLKYFVEYLLITQQYLCYIAVVSFNVGGNLEKTTDLPQETDQLYHIMRSSQEDYFRN